MPSRTAGVALLLVAITLPVRAQQRGIVIRVAPIVVHPLAPFDLYVPDGFGGSAVAYLPLRASPLRIWLGADYIKFGATTRLRPYGTPTSPTRFSLTTGSRMLALTSGLGICACNDSWSAAVDAGAGLAQVTNTSAVSGIYDIDPFARGAVFTDMTWALVAGGSIARRLGGRTGALSLDLSVRYEHLGPTRYVRDGFLPVGVISGVYLKPARTQNSMVTMGVGMSIAFPARATVTGTRTAGSMTGK